MNMTPNGHPEGSICCQGIARILRVLRCHERATQQRSKGECPVWELRDDVILVTVKADLPQTTELEIAAPAEEEVAPEDGRDPQWLGWD
jgi:hypothetical protein